MRQSRLRLDRRNQVSRLIQPKKNEHEAHEDLHEGHEEMLEVFIFVDLRDSFVPFVLNIMSAKVQKGNQHE